MSSSQHQGMSCGSPLLCAAGCGFFGSPATRGMCSLCYKKHCAVVGAEPAASGPVARPAAAAAAVVTRSAASPVAAPAAGISFVPPTATKAEAGVAADSAVSSSSSAPEPAKKKAQPTRCVACCKKVGLTGFVCRCGKTFCGSHRYAEEHGCTFDFKGDGRGAIARANPLIKGEKLSGKI